MMLLIVHLSREPQNLARAWTATAKAFPLSTLSCQSRSLEVDTARLVSRHLPRTKLIDDDERLCIEERQIGHGVTGIYGVENAKCRHGYPQAFIRLPFGQKACSSMIRLSCPHLVKAIDRYEKEGGIEAMDEKLNGDQVLKEDFREINRVHSKLRADSVSPSDAAKITNLLGEEASARLMGSGIIGITVDKVDQVKCLHAHTADYLLRGQNEFGRRTLAALERRGIDPRGCDGCEQQCDVNVPKMSAEWWYSPRKNKAWLKGKPTRRREHRKGNRAKVLRESRLQQDTSASWVDGRLFINPNQRNLNAPLE